MATLDHSVTVREESELSEDFVRGANAKEIQPPIIKSYDFAGERVCC